MLGRLIARVRDYDEKSVGLGRLQTRRVKRLMLKIARQANQIEAKRVRLKRPYQALLRHVEHIVAWSKQVRAQCGERLKQDAFDFQVTLILGGTLEQMKQFEKLALRVMDQARRRVLESEKVPNAEKLFSLFETHTELLIRGKAGKPVEFGNMVLLHEVEHQLISGYDVFEKRPSDESLVDHILKRHAKLFGRLPEDFTADKGFYKSMDKLRELEQSLSRVSIAKKGPRTAAEIEREHDPIFRSLQRFRAGIEGTISVLKRAFKMCRCLYRSFRTHRSSVGSHVFAHTGTTIEVRILPRSNPGGPRPTRRGLSALGCATTS